MKDSLCATDPLEFLFSDNGGTRVAESIPGKKLCNCWRLVISLFQNPNFYFPLEEVN